MHDFLTSKETAELLRIKERKLYELCAEGALPVTKVTGKLLFPREALFAWLRRNTQYGSDYPALKQRPPVVAGSHDPLLEWALRASRSELATWFDGSGDGMGRIARGECMAAGIHFHDETGEDANARRVRRELSHEPVVLIGFAMRTQGLVIAKDKTKSITSIADIIGKRIIGRQPGSGSHALLQQLIAGSGLPEREIVHLPSPALNENDVAQAVAGGHADAGLAIEAVARQYGLGFVPLAVERFDLVVWRRDYFEEPMRRLFEFAMTKPFRDQAAELGGYDVSVLGAIRFNGP